MRGVDRARVRSEVEARPGHDLAPRPAPSTRSTKQHRLVETLDTAGLGDFVPPQWRGSGVERAGARSWESGSGVCAGGILQHRLNRLCPAASDTPLELDELTGAKAVAHASTVGANEIAMWPLSRLTETPESWVRVSDKKCIARLQATKAAALSKDLGLPNAKWAHRLGAAAQRFSSAFGRKQISPPAHELFRLSERSPESLESFVDGHTGEVILRERVGQIPDTLRDSIDRDKGTRIAAAMLESYHADLGVQVASFLGRVVPTPMLEALQRTGYSLHIHPTGYQPWEHPARWLVERMGPTLAQLASLELDDGGVHEFLFRAVRVLHSESVSETQTAMLHEVMHAVSRVTGFTLGALPVSEQWQALTDLMSEPRNASELAAPTHYVATHLTSSDSDETDGMAYERRSEELWADSATVALGGHVLSSRRGGTVVTTLSDLEAVNPVLSGVVLTGLTQVLERVQDGDSTPSLVLGERDRRLLSAFLQNAEYVADVSAPNATPARDPEEALRSLGKALAYAIVADFYTDERHALHLARAIAANMRRFVTQYPELPNTATALRALDELEERGILEGGQRC